MEQLRPLIDHGPLSAFQIWKIVRGRAAEAGFEGITPHDMRRFLITHLLESVDIVMVAKVVGHRQTATTAKYDRRPDVAQRDAIAALDLPPLQTVSDPPAS